MVFWMLCGIRGNFLVFKKNNANRVSSDGSGATRDEEAPQRKQTLVDYITPRSSGASGGVVYKCAEGALANLAR
jgi:hypothetical protein